MASKRETFFINLGASTFGSLNLDPEIYDTSLSAILGVTKTIPAGNSTIVPSTIRQLRKTGKVLPLKLRVQLGTGDAAKYRTITVLCEAAKLSTALASLANGSAETILLGNLVTRAWKIAGLSA